MKHKSIEDIFMDIGTDEQKPIEKPFKKVKKGKSIEDIFMDIPHGQDLSTGSKRETISDEDITRFDFQPRTGIDVREYAAHEQTRLEAAGNDWITGLANVGLNVIRDVGFIAGGVKALTKAINPFEDAKVTDIIGHPFVEFADESSKTIGEDMFPHYLTKDQIENPAALRNIIGGGAGAFWGNTMVRQVAPFFASMFIEGMGAGKIVSSAGNAIKAAKIIEAGGEFAINGAKYAKNINWASKQTSDFVASYGEAMFEAKDKYEVIERDALSRGLSEEEATDLATKGFEKDFILNLAVLKLTAWEFDGLYRGTNKSRKEIKDLFTEYSKLDKVEKAVFIAKKVARHSKNLGKESFEELFQGGVGTEVENQAREGRMEESILETALNSLWETVKRIGTDEGKIEILSSIVLSGGATIGQSILHKEQERENKDFIRKQYESSVEGVAADASGLVTERRDDAGNVINELNQKGRDLLSRAQTFSDYETLKSAASLIGDNNLHNHLRNMQFAKFAYSHFEAGLGDRLDDKIDGYAKKSQEELKKEGIQFLEDTEENRKLTPEQYTLKLKQKAKEYEKVYNTVEERFGEQNPAIREAIYNNAIAQQEVNKNIKLAKATVGEHIEQYIEDNDASLKGKSFSEVQKSLRYKEGLLREKLEKLTIGSNKYDEVNKELYKVSNALNDSAILEQFIENEDPIKIIENQIAARDKVFNKKFYEKLKKDFDYLTNIENTKRAEDIKVFKKEDEIKVKAKAEEVIVATKQVITDKKKSIDNLVTKFINDDGSQQLTEEEETIFKENQNEIQTKVNKFHRDNLIKDINAIDKLDPDASAKLMDIDGKMMGRLHTPTTHELVRKKKEEIANVTPKDVDDEKRIEELANNIINFDIPQSTKKFTDGEKADMMAEIVKLMKLDLNKFTFNEVYEKFVKLFGKEAIAEKFKPLKTAVLSTQNNNDNPNLIKTAGAIIDKDNNLIIGLIPSGNNDGTNRTSDEELGQKNKSLSQRIRDNDPTLKPALGGKKKITEILSVAYKQVESVESEIGGVIKISDKLKDNGDLIFNPLYKGVSSSKIQVGAKIYFVVDDKNNIPTDQDGRDSHKIFIYLAEGVDKDMLLGTVHNVNYVGDLTMAPGDEATQISQIRELRKILLDNKDVRHTTQLIQKGYGVMNISQIVQPIGSLMKKDPSIKIAFAKGNGGTDMAGFDNKEGVTIEPNDNIKKGDVLLLVMHPNGYYFPTHTSQPKLKEAGRTTEINSPFNLVKSAVERFLKKEIDIKPANDILNKWVLTGDKWLYLKFEKGIASLNLLNESIVITLDNISILDEVIGNVYFNLNGKILSDPLTRDAYIEDIKNFGLLRTNLQPNEITHKDGTIEQSYFSQVTLKFASAVSAEKSKDLTTDSSKTTDDIEKAKDRLKEIGETSEKLSKGEDEDDDIQFDLTQSQIDNIKSNTDSLIISNKISPEVQEELKLALAFKLLTTSSTIAQIERREKIELEGVVDTAERFSIEIKYILEKKKNVNVSNKELLKANLTEALSLYKIVNAEKVGDKKKSYDKIIDVYTEILKEGNFDKFYNEANGFLIQLGLEETADGFHEQIEEQEETINQMVDNSAAFENRAETASGEFKKFLYFIPALYNKKNPKTGVTVVKTRKNSLGMDTFNDYTTTFKLIAEELSQHVYTNDMSSLRIMINKLASHPNPILNEIANRLSNEDTLFKIKGQFYTVFNQQHIIYKTVLFSQKRRGRIRNEAAGTVTNFIRNLTGNYINSDRGKAQKIVSKQWEEVFKLQGKELGLLKSKTDAATGDIKRSIDTNKGKELYAKLNEYLKEDLNFLYSKTHAGVDYSINPANLYILQDLLVQIGIPISESGLMDFLRVNREKGVRGYNVKNIIKKNLLDTIFKRITGEMPTEKDVTIYQLNNHFEKEQTSIDLLARSEYKFRDNLFSAAFRANKKTYYTFIRHNPLSKLMQKLSTYVNGRNEYITQKLTHDAFASESKFLQAREYENSNFKFMDSVLLDYRNNSLKGSESKQFRESTVKEYEFLKLTLFLNQGRDSAVFMRDTDSNKSMKITHEITKTKVDGFIGTINNGIELSENTLFDLRRYFRAELKRINKVNSQNIQFKDQPHLLIKEYHSSKSGKQGMGSFFNIYYFLNSEVLKDSNPKLEGLLYKDGEIISYEEYEANKEKIEPLIDEEINNNFTKLFQAKKADWKKQGLWSIEKHRKNRLFRFNINNLFDHRYIKNIAKNTVFNENVDINQLIGKQITAGLERFGDIQIDRAYEQILDHAIIDFVTNYAIYTNEMLMITGDPALQGKGKAISILNRIRSTFDNIGKRNSRLLASASHGLFEGSHYNIAFAKDVAINSKHINEYIKLLSGYSQEAVREAYENGKSTDAQELTTTQEKLDVMLAYRKINKAEYKHLLGLYDRKAYRELYEEDAPRYTQEQRLNSLSIVLQPDKPVQVSEKLDEVFGLTRQYYIKTSSFPILADLVEGTELENLLNDMKLKNVQRLVFNSGVKIGLSNESKSIYGDDGKYNKDFFINNSIELAREHFAIQLEVPFKEDKRFIKEGTQVMKLLFMDLPYNLMTSLGLVKDLQKSYVNIHKRLIQKEIDKLYKLLDYKDGKINNVKALSDLLLEEGKERGYDIASLLGLEINPITLQFKTPLTFLPNSAQIEPVITALLTNRLSKTMMRGRSYVQGSSFILGKRSKAITLEDYKDKRGIIWTKPEYENMETLGYVTIDGRKHSQIILPSYLQKEVKNPITGKMETIFIDMKEFVVDGKFDMSRIDPELLEINGFRIPTGGHNAMMWFEVVGFLPYGVGDLAIVPNEIVAQMGSDFDVDKLFAYFFNYEYKDGRLNKIKSNPTGTKEEMQNAMLDIHKAILTNETVISYMLEPTTTTHLENVIKQLEGTEKEWLGNYSTDYQRTTHFDNIGGDLGTGISANATTIHVTAQQSNLYIKVLGVLFKNKEGKYYQDDTTINRVNELTDDMYGGKVEESAWRLDKIFSFSGKHRRISAVISEWLGASLDNPKDKLIGKGGINEHNFNVGLLLAHTGFDNDWIIPFINQPILKEYYEQLDLLQDSIEISFESDKRGSAKINLIKKYQKEFDILDDEITNVSEGFTLLEYKGMLKTPINKETALMQISILNEFERYADIGSAMRILQSALGVSSKGVGANMVQMNDKAGKSSSLNQKNDIIGNTNRISSDSVEGAFTNIPQVGINLFGKFYAYSSTAYETIKSRLSILMSRNIINEDGLNDIHNSIQEFIYTSPLFGLYNDITETRIRLLFDYETNKSMAKRLVSLQEQFPNDKFIQKLATGSLENNNDPHYIYMGNSSNEGKSFQSIIAAQWVSNIVSYPENSEMRTFFEDLIKYAMLINSSQFADSNLLKYVPYRYLEQIQFGEILSNLNLDNEDLLNNFPEQYLQHNPELTKATKETDVNNIVYKQIEVDGEIKNTDQVLSFTVPNIDDKSDKGKNLIQEIKEAGGVVVTKYRDYVSMFDTSLKSRALFKKTEFGGITKYIRLDKLGDKNSNEYNWNSFTQRTVITSQKSELSPEIVNNQLPNISTLDPSIGDFKTVFPRAQTVGDILSIIESRNANSDNQLSIIYAELAYQLGQKEELNDVRLTHDGKTSSSKHIRESGEKTINIGSSSYESGEQNLHRVILHEVNHGLTQEKLEDKEFQKTDEYKNVVAVQKKYIDYLKDQGEAHNNLLGKKEGEIYLGLFNTVAEIFRGSKAQDLANSSFEESAKVLILSLDGKGGKLKIKKANGEKLEENPIRTLLKNIGLSEDTELSSNDIAVMIALINDQITNFEYVKAKYYPAFSIHEFHTEVLTNQITQRILKQIPSGDKDIRYPTLWDKFVQAILKLHELFSSEPTLLHEAMSSVLAVIEYKKGGKQVVVEKVESAESSSEIYSKLGDKTSIGNVVIKSVYQDAGVAYAKSIGGVFSMRVNNSEKHFGNPFSNVPAEIAKGLIATKSTKESVEKYIDWVINSQEKRAEWVREQLKSGILKDKPIVYYKELNEPSHATALDYLINKYNWGILKGQQKGGIDEFQYYGKKYTIILDESNKGASVDGYKGKNIDMQKILDNYNANPNIDPQNGKHFRFDKATKIVDKTSKQYELFPGVFANEGQVIAIDKIDAFLVSTNSEFLLKGRGGTGKTTLIKRAIEKSKLPKRNIIGATVSDEARGVLQESMKGYSTVTVTSLLGLVPDHHPKTGELYFRERNEEEEDKFRALGKSDKIETVNLIIIDEASMISAFLYEKIMQKKKRDAKVIFMGDNAQIPPIDESGESNDSPVFELEDKPDQFSELTERMRQGKESPILPITDVFAENIENIQNSRAFLKNPLIERVENFNKDKNEGVHFINKMSELISSFVEDFKLSDDLKNVIMVTARNETADNFNKAVREELFNTEEPFVIGDIIRVTSPHVVGGQVELANGFKGRVVNIHDNGIGALGLNTYNLTVEYDDVDSNGVKFKNRRSMTTISPSDKSKLKGAINALAIKAKALPYKSSAQKNAWREFYDLKESIVSIGYNYAITAHKVQGSTYNITYVMEADFMSFPGGDLQRNRMIYTAVSRPRNKLVIFNTTQVVTQIDNTQLDINKSNLGMSIGDFLKTLTKEERTEYYKLEKEGLIKRKCK